MRRSTPGDDIDLERTRGIGWRTSLSAMFVALLIVASCADDKTPATVTVSQSTIRGDHTQDISVWAPDSGTGYPIVYVLHGLANDRNDMAGFATALAREGLVVFVPDIRTATTSGAATDVECGYDLALKRAVEFGGDIDQPVSIVGWSFGAVTALFSALDPNATGLRSQAEGCSLDAQRPDVIVSIAGCYTTWDGDSEPLDPGAMGWINTGAQIVLVAGEEDPVCPPEESETAADTFEAAGFDANVVVIQGADHGAMLFYPPERYGSAEDPQGEAGDETVHVVLDAIHASGE